MKWCKQAFDFILVVGKANIFLSPDIVFEIFQDSRFHLFPLIPNIKKEPVPRHCALCFE